MAIADIDILPLTRKTLSQSRTRKHAGHLLPTRRMRPQRHSDYDMVKRYVKFRRHTGPRAYGSVNNASSRKLWCFLTERGTKPDGWSNRAENFPQGVLWKIAETRGERRERLFLPRFSAFLPALCEKSAPARVEATCRGVSVSMPLSGIAISSQTGQRAGQCGA